MPFGEQRAGRIASETATRRGEGLGEPAVARVVRQRLRIALHGTPVVVARRGFARVAQQRRDALQTPGPLAAFARRAIIRRQGQGGRERLGRRSGLECVQRPVAAGYQRRDATAYGRGSTPRRIVLRCRRGERRGDRSGGASRRHPRCRHGGRRGSDRRRRLGRDAAGGIHRRQRTRGGQRGNLGPRRGGQVDGRARARGRLGRDHRRGSDRRRTRGVHACGGGQRGRRARLRREL